MSSSLHDSGSGFGFPPIFTSRPPTTSGASGEQDDLASTPLISARCWNNYENQNECRNLNVIGPESGEGESGGDTNQENDLNNQQNNEDDGNLITPIVIFESPSSPTESTKSQEKLRPSSSTIKTTTTTPDYGSTILPDLRWPLVKWGPRANSSQVTVGDMTRNGINNNFNTNDNEEQQLPPPAAGATTKRPRFNVYVVTKHPISSQEPKSGASGDMATRRKCVDENDSDCDEPEGDESDTAIEEADDGQDNEDGDDDHDQDGDQIEDNDITNNHNNNSILNSNDSDKRKNTKINDSDGDEMGSGLGPAGLDDDEGGTDDSPDEPTNQTTTSPIPTSKMFKMPTTTPNPSVLSTTLSIYTTTTTTTTSKTTQGAKIEVFVHSTLPPSFPLLTNSDYNSSLKETPSTTTTTTTLLAPDDFFTSKPIYPPGSTERNSDSADNNNQDDNDNPDDQLLMFATTQMPATSTEKEDLHTFKPMPLGTLSSSPVTTLPGNSILSQLGHQMSAATSNTASKQVPGKVWSTYPTTMRPGQGLFDTTLNPWLKQISTTTTTTPDPHLPSPPPRIYSFQQQQLTQSSEMSLSTVLYGLIFILGLLACAMGIVAFGLWRRTVLRSRALLKKAHMMQSEAAAAAAAAAAANQNNGGHYGTTLPPSMSHGSQLVASMAQQPSLLSTYAPGSNGMSTLGKVTSSIVRGANRQSLEQDHDQLLPGDKPTQHHRQQQQHHTTNMIMNNMVHHADLNGDEQRSSLNSKLDLNSFGEPAPNQHHSNQTSHQRHHHLSNNSNNNNNSWATTGSGDDQSGGSTTRTTTTTASSQNSNSSENSQNSKMMLNDLGMRPPQIPMQMPMPIPMQKHQHPIAQNNVNVNVSVDGAMPQHNRMIQFASNHGGWSSGSDGRQQSSSISDSQESQIEMPYQQQRQQQPINNFNMQQQVRPQLIYQPRSMPPPGGCMQSSRSVENLQREQHQQQLMLMHNNQVAQNPNNIHQSIHALHGQPTPFKQALQQHQQVNVSNGRVGLIDPNPTLGGELPNGHNSANGFDPNNLHGPITAANIAMNPLATLTRRYPGLGLTRNILSEDTSSSLVTASPSLARTSSSSSSFALNQRALHNFGLPQSESPLSLRPKAILDGNSRLMNDYTPGRPQTAASGDIGPTDLDETIPFHEGQLPPARPPIVPSRNNRSEAWYV